MQSFQFTLDYTFQRARAGRFQTPHGVVRTPIFMPVGTAATVKALSAEDLESVGAQIILANTYHLAMFPGSARLDACGGIHKFMNWERPVLTDSGGFQVWSLGAGMHNGKDARENTLARISEEGVLFTSHRDGSRQFMTPERSIQIQHEIGADIIMAFDECTPDDVPVGYARKAMERTHRWAERCIREWRNKGCQSARGNYQALFGIIQGAMHEDLRKESAQAIVSLGFDGFAVGGETIGYNMEGTQQVMEWIGAILPEDFPRYAMGVGRDPQDIITAVRIGFDMFDCVAPTRLARNGALYQGTLEGNTPDSWRWISEDSKGRLRIGASRYAQDLAVIEPSCACWTCSHGYTRAYLHFLYKAKELLYYRLASIHNLHMMLRIVEQLRNHIETGT